MPKTKIALTGRKDLPQSAFNFDWENTNSGATCIFQILDSTCVDGFPRQSRVRVLMTENKNVYVVDFGTLGNLKASENIGNISLNDVKPELRIVSADSETEGLLLGSVKLPKSDKTGSADGILHFQKKDTTPLLWDLEINEVDFPVLFLNEEIDDCVNWVQSDPVFLGAVFPVVIERVFTKIFDSDSGQDDGWMAQWILWAEQSMGCDKFPASGTDDRGVLEDWLKNATSTILTKMDLLKDAVTQLNKAEG